MDRGAWRATSPWGRTRGRHHLATKQHLPNTSHRNIKTTGFESKFTEKRFSVDEPFW